MPSRYDDEEDDDRPRKPKKKKKARRRDDDDDRSLAAREAAEKRKKNLVAYILAAVVMIPLLGFAIFMAVRQNNNQETEAKAYAAEMDALTAPPKDGPPPTPTPGKIAVIDVEGKKLAGIQEYIGDESFRAWKPADATAIVHLKVERQVTDTYTNGSNAVKLTWHVTVIDKKTWTVLGKKSFPGGDPPLIAFGKTAPEKDITGDAPKNEELTEYFKSVLGVK